MLQIYSWRTYTEECGEKKALRKSSEEPFRLNIQRSSSIDATAAGINTCLPTVGQVTTAVATGKKKREASKIDETRPGNTPVVTLDGQPNDFNDIISPSRVYRREVFIDFWADVYN